MWLEILHKIVTLLQVLYSQSNEIIYLKRVEILIGFKFKSEGYLKFINN